MSKTALGLLLSSIVVVGGLWIFRSSPEPVPFEPNIQWKEPAPVCPWRDPAGDIQEWFPSGAGYQEEACVLSHLRAELENAFGHPPEPSDLAPTLFKILGKDGNSIGTVMTRRVKGEHGAIEIAVPFDLEGKIFALKVQRDREPEHIGKYLSELETRRKLIGQAESPIEWPEEFKPTVQAIGTGLNQLRVLFKACQKRSENSQKRHH